MFKASFTTTVGLFLLLLLCHTAPVLAQGQPFQIRVTGTCSPGSSIRVINPDGSVVCEPDDAGLTAACSPGSSIRVINTDGSVVCEPDDAGVTAVTTSPPLTSSGGTTPNIALPNVIIDPNSTPGITAIGTDALQLNTTGFSNTAIGYKALFLNTTGSLNTATGHQALENNTTGYTNTATGVQALFNNTTGAFNTATGEIALQNNTTGHSNTAVGAQALFSNTTGNLNTACGESALSYNTTGHSNAATGLFALGNNTTGTYNTATGAVALRSNTTGNDNTAIGVGADVSAGDLNNATAIGAAAIVDADNKIRLGNTAVTVIEGQVPFSFTSDATKKENFQPVNGEEVLQKMRGLSLTSWNFIGHDPEQFRHYGPMGQEFFAAFGSDGIGTIGTPTTINSGDMAGILMIAVQALERRTSEQRAQIETLRTENAALQSRLESVETAARARETVAQR